MKAVQKWSVSQKVYQWDTPNKGNEEGIQGSIKGGTQGGVQGGLYNVG